MLRSNAWSSRQPCINCMDRDQLGSGSPTDMDDEVDPHILYNGTGSATGRSREEVNVGEEEDVGKSRSHGV